jgi:hypothetical protein
MPERSVAAARASAQSLYAVHWVLNDLGPGAGAYAEAIRQNWWSRAGAPGRRKVHVDYLSGVAAVTVELVADDALDAATKTQELVARALSARDLVIPSTLMAIVAPA